MEKCAARPLGDRILVKRLEGHGIEQVSPGGIILPATQQARTRFKRDTFRAHVLAIGDEAARALAHDLAVGDDVYVFTFHGAGDKVFTGENVEPHGLMVRAEDIVCAVEGA